MFGKPHSHMSPESNPITYSQENEFSIVDEMPSFLIETIGLREGMRVLDASCDSGRLLPYLQAKLQRTGQIFALNPAREGLHGITGSEGVAVLNASADNIPLGDSIVDLIVCLSSFTGFLNLEAVIFEFFRILKPGGKALIVHSGWETGSTGDERETESAGRPPCPAGLNALFTAAGFFRNNIIYLPNWFVFMADKRGQSLGRGRVL
jgi:SAM-dependent methyltransferase